MSLFPKFQNPGQKVDPHVIPAVPAFLVGENLGNRGNRIPLDLDHRDSANEKPSLKSGWGRLHWTDDSGSMKIDWEKDGVRIPVDSDDMKEFLARQNSKPVVWKKGASKDPSMLNIMDLDIRSHPDPDLLTEVEQGVYNQWYATMINPSPKYGEVALSHEEASLLAWKYILDSIKNQHDRGEGRYVHQKSKEIKNG